MTEEKLTVILINFQILPAFDMCFHFTIANFGMMEVTLF